MDYDFSLFLVFCIVSHFVPTELFDDKFHIWVYIIPLISFHFVPFELFDRDPKERGKGWELHLL